MAIPNLKRFQKHVALKMENLANLEKSMVWAESGLSRVALLWQVSQHGQK